MSKYGKPVWELVFEAAKSLKTETFTPTDIVNRVHETTPEVPAVTIRSYIIAMAPNHPFSGHWPSTRKLHGLFEYLEEGRFRFREKVEAPKATKSEKHAEVYQTKKRFWHCIQCGYVVYRENPPLTCPICRAKREMFKELKMPVGFKE
jgi:rubrerythrin